MTYQARIDPKQSPTIAFSPLEIAVLERVATTQKPARRTGQPLTLREADPGVKTLWRGYRQLQLLCWWNTVLQIRRKALLACPVAFRTGGFGSSRFFCKRWSDHWWYQDSHQLLRD